MKPKLSHSHLRTFRTVFQHPISHNLEWRDLKSLFGELGEVTEEHNGNLRVEINNQVLVLSSAHGKDVASSDELMEVRHFLDRSGLQEHSIDQSIHHMLVVIDHAGANVFELEMKSAIPHRIVPYDPRGLERHFHTSQSDISIHESANRKSFYEDIAKTIKDSQSIFVLGDGTGSSSEMSLFLAELKEHHPQIFDRVAGSHVADLKHRTDGQLLALAREFYEKTPVRA